MAIAKTARLESARMMGPDTRLLELCMDEPLGFVGGQYVIVDSGLTLPSGKAAKRAYSLLSADTEQRRFRLASKRIPQGLVSGYLHGVTVGSEMRFSGPWGKLVPQPESSSGGTFVLATDTGITAALGLLQGARFRPLLGSTVLLWLRGAPDYFLPEAFVREQIPAGCAEVRIEPFVPIGHPERAARARALFAQHVQRAGRPARAFVSGDGAVNYALLDDLLAAGVPATRDNLESFFNMPKKSD
jgi:ferredoxin-NADP reductase